MDATAIIISIVVSYVAFNNAVPPQACFANFRWDDCGHPPTPVMYYWKPGSRCAVGIWRGCQPSLNMFKTEYECVSTCIFTTKPRPLDYHKVVEEEDDYDMGEKSSSEDAETSTENGGSGSGDGGSGDASGSGDESGSGSANGDVSIESAQEDTTKNDTETSDPTPEDSNPPPEDSSPPPEDSGPPPADGDPPPEE